VVCGAPSWGECWSLLRRLAGGGDVELIVMDRGRHPAIRGSFHAEAKA
jgi:hypothetical protein